MALRNFGLLEASTQLANANAAVVTEGANLSMFGHAVDRMTSMYDHVAQFGIDKTFLRLYNSHNELDRAIGMQFPSCESMDVIGSPYDRVSTAFMAAMEDEGEGIWAKIKALVAKIWNWIKEKVSAVYNWVKKLFGSTEAKANQIEKQIDADPESLCEIPTEIAQDPTFLQKIKGGLSAIAGGALSATGGAIKSGWDAVVYSKDKLVGFAKSTYEAHKLYAQATQTLKKLTAVNADIKQRQTDLESLHTIAEKCENAVKLLETIGKHGNFDSEEAIKKRIVGGKAKFTSLFETLKKSGAVYEKNGRWYIEAKNLKAYIKDVKKETSERESVLKQLEKYKDDTLRSSPELNAVVDSLQVLAADTKGIKDIKQGKGNAQSIPLAIRKDMVSETNRILRLQKVLTECDAKLSASLGDSTRAKILHKIKVHGIKDFLHAVGGKTFGEKITNGGKMTWGSIKKWLHI